MHGHQELTVVLVRFATTTEGQTHELFQMDASQSYYKKLKRKKLVRKIVLIKPNTTSSPLDEVVYTLQLLGFCLALRSPK